MAKRKTEGDVIEFPKEKSIEGKVGTWIRLYVAFKAVLEYRIERAKERGHMLRARVWRGLYALVITLGEILLDVRGKIERGELDQDDIGIAVGAGRILEETVDREQEPGGALHRNDDDDY